MKLIDFFIVGAMRSGTSTLAHSLRRHPEIYMLRTEPKFFKSWDGKDLGALKEYHSRFDWSPKFTVRGEKSAPYGPSLYARDRIKAYNPNARIIWLFRDPVKRAISHYYRAFAAAGEKAVTLEKAIAEKDALEDSNSMHAYIYRSEYYKQLMMWRQVFFDRQIHWAIFEEVIESPKAEIEKICRFLSVDPSGEIYPEYQSNSSKTTSHGREMAPVTDATIEALRDAIRPDMEAFFDFIGRRISAWEG